MSAVCPWCHDVISEDDEGPVTNGICRNCAAGLQLMPQSFDSFLDTLAGPVLAVDHEGRVLGANIAAASMVRLDPAEAKGKLGGDVVGCVYAELPEGCGQTVHCPGCAIRRAFEHTARTGESVREAPAFSQRRGLSGPVRIAYLVSTERLGDDLVLVQLEPVDPEGSADFTQH